MKAMDSSMEEEELIVETVTSTKKKMKQAQLPFQLSSKSPDTQHNVHIKKKRKLVSPLVEVKKSKMIKLSTKENSTRNIFEDKEEDSEVLNLKSDVNELNIVEVTKKKGRKEKEQVVQQSHENKKGHVTTKKSSLRKRKKLDKFEQKSGALTKFLKVSNRETKSESIESKNEEEAIIVLESPEHDSCQNPNSDIVSSDKASSKLDKTSKRKKLSKNIINKSPPVVTPILEKKKKKFKNLKPKQLDLSSENKVSSELDKSVSSASEKVIDELPPVVIATLEKKEKKCKTLTPEQLDLSSDNEASSELNKSASNTSEEVIIESTSAISIPEKKKKKLKNLTPKQLDSSSENETLSELDKSASDINRKVNNESPLNTSEKVINNESACVTPTSDKKKKVKVLTPKQLEKMREIARKREEKLQLKEERRKQQEAEKANRRRQREERQREKEERERIEREEKRREKQLKELRKQMEIEQKQKEREAKEEERRKREEAKVEEKRKKDEEKLEAERKKQKAASNFASFFTKKQEEKKSAEEEKTAVETNFMPFEVKADMRIAPINRRTITEEEKLALDKQLNKDVPYEQLYFKDIIHGRHVLKTCLQTWPLEAKDDEIVLLDEDNDGTSNNNIIKDTHNLEKHRPKLLQFCENRRPPYWGTWRKRSDVVTPTQPFLKDKKFFDYTVDSDDEWEEEEPGESLKGSDDEKDDENSEENDEYDVDNEFMVPHGYLSDEEARADEEEIEDMSPQTQKMKLKILGEQFEAERNTKTQKLKPKLIGCVWQGLGDTFPESTSSKIKELLLARQAWVSNIPIILPSPECKTQTPQQSVREKTKSKKTKLSGETLPDVLQLLHRNTHRKHLSAKKIKTNTETEMTKPQTTNSV